VQRIQRTEPIITFKGDPEPPDLPTEDEAGDVQARVDAVGSSQVGDAATDFYAKVQAFFTAAAVYRMMRDQPGQDFTAAHETMMKAREEVSSAFNEVRTAVRTDLADL
jgi:hypothetical protein